MCCANRPVDASYEMRGRERNISQSFYLASLLSDLFNKRQPAEEKRELFTEKKNHCSHLVLKLGKETMDSSYWKTEKLLDNRICSLGVKKYSFHVYLEMNIRILKYIISLAYIVMYTCLPHLCLISSMI